MKIWAKTDGEVREGKYLVVRRDGTVPEWPHFVIGGFDPAGGTGLAFYAAKAAELGFDGEYVASIQELAVDFDALSATPRAKAIADPDAGPHRKDCPAVIEMMRGHGDVATLVARLSRALRSLKALQAGAAIAMAQLPDDGTVPDFLAAIHREAVRGQLASDEITDEAAPTTGGGDG